MGGGIEFLGELGPEPDPDEERLEAGPGRGGPRRGLIVGALVVVGALVAVLTTHGGGRPAATASSRTEATATGRPTAAHTVAPPPVPSLQFLAPSAFATLANPVPVNPAFQDVTGFPFGGGPIVAAAFLSGAPDRSDGVLVVLEPGWLARAALPGDGLSVSPGVRVPRELGDPTYPTSGHWQLISAGPAVWALAPGVPDVYRVDARTLTGLRLIPVPGTLLAAVALDGRLYLATDRGLFSLAPTQPGAHRVLALPGLRAVAADPSRHRLLLLAGDRVSAVSVSAGHGRLGVSRRLPVDVRDLAVGAGAIWITALAGHGAPVLDRLDPRTLRVAGSSPVSGQFGGAPQVAAVGGADLWLRSSGTANALWCITARTGAVAQHWTSVPGLVAARSGAVLVIYPDAGGVDAGGADRSSVGRLRLNAGCTG